MPDRQSNTEKMSVFPKLNLLIKRLSRDTSRHPMTPERNLVTQFVARRADYHKPCYGHKDTAREECKEEETDSISFKSSKPADNELACQCFNCQDIFEKFSECAICLESLQGSGIGSCSFCGGIWCKRCTSKMSKCPFCRSNNRHFNPNPALARLIDGLSLPCRNHRRGCKKFLTIENRSEHEEACNYERVSCPFDEACSASVSYEELKDHLALAHSTPALYNTNVNILLHELERKLKLSQNVKTKYIVFLLCHKSAFKVNVSTYGYKLLVEVVKTKLGFRPSAAKKAEYFAMVEFESPALTTQSAFSVSQSKPMSQKAELHYNECDVNYSTDSNVYINITIAPINKLALLNCN